MSFDTIYILFNQLVAYPVFVMIFWVMQICLIIMKIRREL